MEGEVEKENQEEEGDINFTPHEHERALKGAYRSLVIPSAPKADVDSYFDQTKPHIKTLIKNQLKEMGSALQDNHDAMGNEVYNSTHCIRP